jgi:hypothetical protein
MLDPRIPARKKRIALAIKRAGNDGISLVDLYGLIYGNDLPPLPSRYVLKAHVWQLRKNYGLPIVGFPGGMKDGGFRWRRT